MSVEAPLKKRGGRPKKVTASEEVSEMHKEAVIPKKRTVAIRKKAAAAEDIDTVGVRRPPKTAAAPTKIATASKANLVSKVEDAGIEDTSSLMAATNNTTTLPNSSPPTDGASQPSTPLLAKRKKTTTKPSKTLTESSEPVAARRRSVTKPLTQAESDEEVLIQSVLIASQSQVTSSKILSAVAKEKGADSFGASKDESVNREVPEGPAAASTSSEREARIEHLTNAVNISEAEIRALQQPDTQAPIPLVEEVLIPSSFATLSSLTEEPQTVEPHQPPQLPLIAPQPLPSAQMPTPTPPSSPPSSPPPPPRPSIPLKDSPFSRPTLPKIPPAKSPQPSLTSLNATAVNSIATPAGSRPIDVAKVIKDPRYKAAAGRWTRAMVALPIAIVSSWFLYERVVLQRDPKRLARPWDRVVEGDVTGKDPASPVSEASGEN